MEPDLRGKRTLRKIEAMCTDKLDVYECDSCLWMAHVPPTQSFDEIEMDFRVHDCKKHSLSKMLEAKSKD
jgi:hypothetical protein